MSLPEQLQKQVDEAKSIIAQHYGPEAGTDESKDPPAEQEGTDAATAAQGAATEVPAVATAQQPGESDESYAQRWRSLQGIYNATQHKLNAAQQRNAELERMLASVQQPRQAPAAAQPATFITDKDSEEFGEDMIGFAKRAAKEELAPFVGALQALREEVAQLKGVVPVVRNVAANQQKSAESDFFEKLSQRVPQWQAINGDGRFHDWLLSPDPMTGITRQTYLEDAQRSFDLDRVVSIFKLWAPNTGAAADTQETRTPTQGSPRTAKEELERQVAPGKANASTAAPQKQARQWSPAQIAKFYSDARRGVYEGRAAEKDALERDLFLAQREGRIVQDAA